MAPYAKGIATDKDGDVYITDFQNNCVKRYHGDGTFVTKWGRYGTGPGGLNQPFGIAVDSDGNVYVADGGNHRMQKFTGMGAFIVEWGSYGSGEGQFDDPRGVAVDALGNVYVADLANDRISKFGPGPTPTVPTTWGRLKALYR